MGFRFFTTSPITKSIYNFTDAIEISISKQGNNCFKTRCTTTDDSIDGTFGSFAYSALKNDGELASWRGAMIVDDQGDSEGW